MLRKHRLGKVGSRVFGAGFFLISWEGHAEKVYRFSRWGPAWGTPPLVVKGNEHVLATLYVRLNPEACRVSKGGLRPLIQTCWTVLPAADSRLESVWIISGSQGNRFVVPGCFSLPLFHAGLLGVLTWGLMPVWPDGGLSLVV